VPYLVQVETELNEEMREYLYNCFCVLWGTKEADRLPQSHLGNYAVLIEENFTRNIGKILGVECPFFGKLLYMQLGGGYDQAKITLQKWFNFFKVFANEELLAQQKACFSLLDLDKDHELNIINLTHLWKNLPGTS
jgi:hypothetical protein